MSKLPNIIQRRELEPLLLKADKMAIHYEKASNCSASVMGPDYCTQPCQEAKKHGALFCCNQFNSICSHCSKKPPDSKEKTCTSLHIEAVKKAKQLGGSYIYVCSAGLVFWTSPFYYGERFAGAFLSGGVKGSAKNSGRVKALANMMLVYADQISSMSFTQKNTKTMSVDFKTQCSLLESIAECNSYPEDMEVNSIDMERIVLASLRRGDITEAKKQVVNLLKTYCREVKHNFQAFRLKAMELTVLLSRAASDLNDTNVLDTNERYLKKIEESQSFDEIKDNISAIMEKIAGNIFSFHGVRHFSALKKAERFIWQNYTRKLSLREIAAVSGLSAPYFSTIFKEEMGENLSDYLNRLRVEKAGGMLLTSNLPISEIATACGFEDQSWFSKIFKNNTGFTPGKYRDQGSIMH
jgi:AraC-like DNA-binding protein/ligand-binding sensor protein